MNDSFNECAKVIDDILAQTDSFTVNRLMQAYETAPYKTAFVAALIGRVMLNAGRYQ